MQTLSLEGNCTPTCCRGHLYPQWGMFANKKQQARFFFFYIYSIFRAALINNMNLCHKKWSLDLIADMEVLWFTAALIHDAVRSDYDFQATDPNQKLLLWAKKIHHQLQCFYGWSLQEHSDILYYGSRSSALLLQWYCLIRTPYL